MLKKYFSFFVISFSLILISSTKAYAANSFDTSVIDWAIGELCGHITGHLGGLLVTVAGFGAIVSAALGSFRVTYSAIIVAVGAFAISTIMSLYFGKGNNNAASICLSGGSNQVAPNNNTPPSNNPPADSPNEDAVSRLANPFSNDMD